MLEVRKRGRAYLTCLFIAAFTILTCSCSTSPLYDLFFADYYNNASSTALLMGKSWLQGSIPYRDLFSTGGPAFYLIQSVGWLIGGRSGVCMLQILSLSVGLFLLHGTYWTFVSERKAWLLLLLTEIPIFATFSGGNSEEEFCLTLSAAALYLAADLLKKDVVSKKSVFLLGLLAGVVLMVKITGGGAVYGVCLFVIIHSFKKEGKKAAFERLEFLLLGCFMVVVSFMAYFAVNNSIWEMVEAVFGYHFKAMWVKFGNLTLLLHKSVKCIPVFFLILAGGISFARDRGAVGALLCIVGIGLLFFTFTGNGYWHTYLPTAFCLPLLLAVLPKKLPAVLRRWVVGGCILCIIGIFALPVKYYIVYVATEDITPYQQLTDALLNYQKETGNKELLLIDIPSSVYLKSNTTPGYRFFAEQSEYNKAETTIREQINAHILEPTAEQIIVIRSTGAVYLEIGDYVMCDTYYHGNELFAVYEYLPGE